MADDGPVGGRTIRPGFVLASAVEEAGPGELPDGGPPSGDLPSGDGLPDDVVSTDAAAPAGEAPSAPSGTLPVPEGAVAPAAAAERGMMPGHGTYPATRIDPDKTNVRYLAEIGALNGSDELLHDGAAAYGAHALGGPEGSLSGRMPLRVRSSPRR